MSRRRFLRTAGIGVSAALAGCTDRFSSGPGDESGQEPTVLSTYKYDTARTGAVETTLPGEQAGVKWRVEPEVQNAIMMSWPAVNPQTFYAGIGTFGDFPGALVALDIGTGEERWRHQPGGTGPTLVDGRLYLGGDPIRTLSADDGREYWSYQTERSARTPAVVDGGAYTAGHEWVYALDATDGRERWTHEHGGNVTSLVAVADGSVYLNQASPDSHGGPSGVTAVRVTDGTQRWQTSTGGGRQSPAIAGGTVYVADHGNTVYALNATDGTEQWRTSIPQVRRPSTPTIGDTRLFCLTKDRVFALDRATGQIEWTQPASAPFSMALTLVGDHLVIPTDGAIDIRRTSDGSADRVYPLEDAGLITSVSAFDGTIYLSTLSKGQRRFRIQAIGE